MNTIEFLEKLACTVHHKIEMDMMINDQPVEIQNAFLTNNSVSLKAYLNNLESFLADRGCIFKL